ncbi:yecA family protein [Asticcacaulis biprosthecium C19]|uniref:YecA family protein n=1 Tax=Asticcacaulis biprosthecium C19 TaxID=715226 RepID=F4QNB5_9CAUL|nr:UPF0149 family protein [Asticcacaulis biprosthecium]EGF90823.1 yecA family protein [Asticcacaulis biprosthecium C19]
MTLVTDEAYEARLESLHERLKAHDSIGLPALDGFVAALAVMPSLPTERWMAFVLEEPEADPASQLMLETEVLMHSSLVFQEFMDGTYIPQFMKAEYDKILWQDWALGFADAARFHPTFVDETLAGHNEEATAALNIILGLAGLAIDAEAFRQDIGDPEEFKAKAPVYLIQSAYALFKSRYGERPIPRRTIKIGRNDPCPCGSGKKYKKCCGGAA